MSILDQISEEIRQIISNEDSLSIEEWKWNSRNFGQYLFLQVRTIRREVERDFGWVGWVGAEAARYSKMRTLQGVSKGTWVWVPRKYWPGSVDWG